MTKQRKDKPRIPLFQEGGIIDENDLFSDLDPVTPPADGPLDPPVDIDPPADPPQDPPADPPQPADPPINAQPTDPPQDPPADPPAAPPLNDVDLTGVEQFLSNYGVQGGMITYEDGTSVKFQDLESDEQANILSSLVQNSTPSVEEKYNLDDSEIDLLNNIRQSGRSVEDFINDLVDYRTRAVDAQQQMLGQDFKEMSDDAVFVKHYMATNPEATDEDIAQELVKAKELSSFKATTDALRNSMISTQEQIANQNAAKQSAMFNQELEAQRQHVVQSIEDIEDIAGARVTENMKEYLLHDIMELNENKDPILMEKIFSDPNVMFKTNWFLNYGEDYIKNLNAYYKKEISKARKAGYEEAVNGMPGNPTIIAGGDKTKQPGPQQGNPEVSFGRELTEEELFDLED